MPGIDRRVSAFTLVELLVVVSILALLVGLVLPVLGAAREAAKSAVCLSNLRQMTMAYGVYAHEHGGALPLNYVTEGGDRRYWFGLTPLGAAAPRPLDQSDGLVTQYLGGVPGGLLCPAFPYDHGDFFEKFAERSSSYGLNLNLSPFEFSAAARGVPVDVADVHRPARAVAFADGVQFWQTENGFNEAAYLGIDDLSYRAYADPLDDPNGGFAHFRHDRRTQLGFLDGHAAGRGFEDVPRTHAELGGSPAGHLTAGDRGPDTIYARTW